MLNQNNPKLPWCVPVLVWEISDSVLILPTIEDLPRGRYKIQLETQTTVSNWHPLFNEFFDAPSKYKPNSS